MGRSAGQQYEKKGERRVVRNRKWDQKREPDDTQLRELDQNVILGGKEEEGGEEIKQKNLEEGKGRCEERSEENKEIY